MVKNFPDFLKESSEASHVTLAKKFHALSKASEIPTKVTELRKKDRSYTFNIYTKIPYDSEEKGTKIFSVIVPDDERDPYIKISEGEKKTLTIHLKKEKDLRSSLTNFIEITQLFDDPLIQIIVDNHERIKDFKDVKQIISHR